MIPVIQENVSLAQFNTFGIDVSARWFVEITSEQALGSLLKSGFCKDKPLLVLGGGSNILFTKDFDGLVIRIDIQGVEAQISGNLVMVKAGAGVSWKYLVNHCVEKGFAGLENLSLIPGTVGASPVQNIGAYGVELKDVFESCVALNIERGERRVFTYPDCGFGYRESVFKSVLKGQYIITEVTYRLSTVPALNLKYGAISQELEHRQIENPTIADVARVVSEIRVSKLPDPSTIGNAGSFFKNPIISKAAFEALHAQFPAIVCFPVGDAHVKLAAGWLIEQCGFKGKVVGNTGTWKNQALVIVNHGTATGQEVYNFSEQIIETVASTFGVKLEREVNIL
jgi:UDP-N-acetylmuramate dehydrogenase